MIADFQADFPLPILITLHMPKIYTEVFAEELDNLSNLDVGLATDGEYVQTGQIRIAPGGYHMTVKGPKEHAHLHIHRGSLENQCRPSIDALFRSVAEVYGPHTIGYIISGRGRDGVFGARKITEMGGQLLLNDPDQAVERELINQIVDSGIDYRVVGVDNLVHYLARLLKVKGVDTSMLIPKSETDTLPLSDEEDVQSNS
jgi:two-component system chemotaxis response regulator CheB